MMAVERGAALNTIESYGRDLNDFSLFVMNRSGDPGDARLEHIRDYLKMLDGKNVSAATIARRISVLRRFFKFLYAEKLRNDDPSASISSPKKAKSLPKFLSQKEVEMLLDYVALKKGPSALRLIALLEILYATGLRVSELVGLPVSAITRDEKFLIVRGKGGKERMVPLSKPAQDATRNYFEVRQKFVKRVTPNSDQNPWLFPSRGIQGHLTRSRFSQLLKDLSEEVGIPKSRISPHILRHSFASHLLANGADLRSLQQMLGHSDISTTQIYTHVLSERMTALVTDVHPLSKNSHN